MGVLCPAAVVIVVVELIIIYWTCDRAPFYMVSPVTDTPQIKLV